jgi:TPR repeat protein
MIETKLVKAVRRELRKTKPNIAQALKELQRASDKGDASAAYALGTWHLHGKHVKVDMRRGAVLLKQAAAANIPEALYDLAVCYEKGAGVRESEKKAYELYLRAALWGDRQSIYEVGRCLFYGIGADRNRRLARFWLTRAKSLGLS